MTAKRPTFDQLNIVSGDTDASIAFYRRLGVDIPEESIWRTSTGAHHVNTHSSGAELEIDSAKFAAVWNDGWRGRSDLAGRVVIGFSVDSRQEVDRLYAELTEAGHKGCRHRTMRSGVPATPSSRIPTASPSA